MVVITMTNCPPRLRGDLSKWMMEINTGVYVGHMSSRVRELLWQRVCQNITNGRATMVYSAAGEQHMEFRVHNTTWEPVDLDGLHLIRRPFQKEDSTGEDGKKRPEPSQARINLLSRVKPRRCNDLQDYTIIDIETTGLTPADSEILEMAALRVRGGSEAETFSAVVKIKGKFPDTIAKLTGISPDEIEMGQPIDKVLGEFREFLGQDMLVGYNVPFDCSFINAASRKARLPRLANRQLDVMTLAKKILRGLDSYRLEAVAKILNLGGQEHRALADCRLVQVVLDKLNEFRQPSK